MPCKPTVLCPITLPALLHYILTSPSGTAPTTLVICSSRDAFLQDLLLSLQYDQSTQHNDDLQDLATPSLHNLLTTRHVRLAFCASVQTLLAHLTASGKESPSQSTGRDQARLVLVNPLALHASTPSFSAQGLSRTFSAAREVALKTGALLYVAECQIKHRNVEGEDKDMNDKDDIQDVNMSNEDENELNTMGEQQDPWEQDVSILNVSARRFGSNSGERAWAGRTVKAKRIAARWFRFQHMDDHETRQGLG